MPASMATPMVTAVSMVSMPIVVHHVIGLGDKVKIVDAAAGAEAPDGFILKARGQVRALFIIVDLGALDDAAGVAAVAGLAAALDDGVVHGFAADFVMAVEPAGTEVLRGQAARFVQDIDQNIGAVGLKALAGNRMVQQGFRENAGGFLELFRIGYGRRPERRYRQWRYI